MRVEIIYKLVTRTIQYFCFPNRPKEGGDIYRKGGILEKGVELEKGGMTPLMGQLKAGCQVGTLSKNDKKMIKNETKMIFVL